MRRTSDDEPDEGGAHGVDEGSARTDALTHPVDHLARATRWLDRCSRRAWFTVVIGPVLFAYLLTASWSEPLSPDTYLNQLTAHHIADQGTVYLDDRANDRLVPAGQWIIETPDGHLISLYSPGVAFHAAPLYLLAGDTEPVVVTATDHFAHDRDLEIRPVRLELVRTWPAALTAVLLTTATMILLALSFRRLVRPSAAADATWVAAFATSAWSVGADELWQHTATMTWIAASGYFLARSWRSGSALATALAIVVRPLTVLVALGPAAVAAVRHRWSDALLAAAGATVGLASIVLYNNAVYGRPSLEGGYGTSRADALVERFPGWIIANFASGLFSPRYGLLVWSPFLVLLLLGVRQAWREAPQWVRGPAVGGAVYLVAHWSLEIASGGAAYYYYRYPLETLVSSAPLLLLAYRYGVQPHDERRRWFWILVGLAALAHGVVATG